MLHSNYENCFYHVQCDFFLSQIFPEEGLSFYEEAWKDDYGEFNRIGDLPD